LSGRERKFKPERKARNLRIKKEIVNPLSREEYSIKTLCPL